MSSKSNSLLDQPNKVPHNQFYTLEACALDAAHDVRAGDEAHEYCLKYAIEAYKELQMDTLREIDAIEVDMLPHKQIDFPCESIDITKIGFRCGDIIKTMTVDKNIPRVWNMENCEPVENMPLGDISMAPVGSIPLAFFGFDNSTGMVGPMYYGLQLTHNGVGYYNIDTKHRVINFKQVSYPGKVYLEYITDGINYNGHTIVHPYAYQAVKKYIKWARIEDDPKMARSEKDAKKYQWEDELQKLEGRMLDMNIEDVKEILMSSKTQTARS